MPLLGICAKRGVCARCPRADRRSARLGAASAPAGARARAVPDRRRAARAAAALAVVDVVALARLPHALHRLSDPARLRCLPAPAPHAGLEIARSGRRRSSLPSSWLRSWPRGAAPPSARGSPRTKPWRSPSGRSGSVPTAFRSGSSDGGSSRARSGPSRSRPSTPPGGFGERWSSWSTPARDGSTPWSRPAGKSAACCVGGAHPGGENLEGRDMGARWPVYYRSPLT